MNIFKEKGNFKEDKKKHNEILKYAIKLLKEDKSVEEAREILLDSQLYKEWKSKRKVFGDGFKDKRLYEDLKSQIDIEKSCKELEAIAKEFFLALERKEDVEINSEKKHFQKYNLITQLVRDLDYDIQEEELAYELAKLSFQLELDSIFPVLSFISLLNENTICTNNDTINKELSSKQDTLLNYLREFEQKYKKNKIFDHL